MLREWGPSGDWQVPRTEWKAAIEDTSTEKCRLYLERYQDVVMKDAERCLGSHAFIWGAHHERTQTWFGMPLPTGERTEAVNAMQFAWTGQWPANRAARIEDFRIGGRTAADNIDLRPGTVQKPVVRSVDPEGDPLTVRW